MAKEAGKKAAAIYAVDKFVKVFIELNYLYIFEVLVSFVQNFSKLFDASLLNYFVFDRTIKSLELVVDQLLFMLYKD